MIQNKKTTRYSKKQNRHLPVIIAIGVVVFICLAICVYFFFTKNSDQFENDSGSDPLGVFETSEPKPEENPYSESNPENKAPKQYSENTSSELSDSLSGIITLAEHDQFDYINIHTTIPELSVGTCEFTLTNPSGQSVTATTNLEKDPAASYCVNPHFSASQFGTSGTWTIVIKLISGSKTGTITGEVQI